MWWPQLQSWVPGVRLAPCKLITSMSGSLRRRTSAVASNHTSYCIRSRLLSFAGCGMQWPACCCSCPIIHPVCTVHVVRYRIRHLTDTHSLLTRHPKSKKPLPAAPSPSRTTSRVWAPRPAKPQLKHPVTRHYAVTQCACASATELWTP
jgi:hypothetical protein